MKTLPYLIVTSVLIIGFIALAVLHAPQPINNWVCDRQGKALEACVAQSGVPFLDADGNLNDCRWSLK